MVLYGVFGAVGSCFSVTFYVAKRDAYRCYAWRLAVLRRSFAGGGISKEEGDKRLVPSSTDVAGMFGQL